MATGFAIDVLLSDWDDSRNLLGRGLLLRGEPSGRARELRHHRVAPLAGDCVPYGAGPLSFSDAHMRLRGPHNRANAEAALAAARVFGATPAHLESVLATFDGLPHRLEDLGVHAGVRWINDSIATAPEAAVAALDAFGADAATYIGGGTDRGFDFGPLARALVARGVAHVILLPPGGPAILAALAAIDPAAASEAHVVADLAEAVATAARVAPPGSTVVFSPASPSYGTYTNFEERGNAYRRLVDAL
jgi:UDP-N-acetylmuramoylalanine--D-glutamate ligase